MTFFEDNSGIVLIIATTALAVYSLFYDNNDKGHDKKVKKKWKRGILIGMTIIIGAISVWNWDVTDQKEEEANGKIDALKSKNDSLTLKLEEFRSEANNSFNSLDSNLLKRFNTTLENFEDVRLKLMRLAYPLEPLTIVYVVEIPMDIPYFEDYAQDVYDTIRFKWKRRPVRGALLTHKKNKELKDLARKQDYVYKKLFSAHDVFLISPDNNKDDFIGFISLDSNLKANYGYHKPLKGEPKIQVSVTADFINRIFIKSVVAYNPIRVGPNDWAISKIDLIGKELTWVLMEDDGFNGDHYKMKKLELRFTNSYREGSHYIKNRGIEIGEEDKVLLNEEMLGLEKVLSK